MDRSPSMAQITSILQLDLGFLILCSQLLLSFHVSLGYESIENELAKSEISSECMFWVWNLPWELQTKGFTYFVKSMNP